MQAEEATAVRRKEEDDGGGVGQTVYPATVIYFSSGNLRQILAVHGEGETAERIQPYTCQYRVSRGVHYARQSRKPCRLFLTRAWDMRSNAVNGRDVRPVDPPYV
jgi:hypothetical protein